MRTPLHFRSAETLFLCACFIFIVVGVLAHRSILNFNDVVNELDFSQSVLTAVEDIQSEITNLEYGGRGYIFSGKEMMLEPYVRAKSVIPEKIESMMQMAEAQPRLRGSVESIQLLTGELMSLHAEAISEYRSSGPDTEKQSQFLEMEYAAGANLRTLLIKFAMQEQELVAAGAMRSKESANWAIGLMTIGLFLGVALIIGAILLLKKEIKERARAEGKVKVLNRELSERAKELEEANRDLESFGSSVSHDLRHPLRTIEMYSEILAEDHGAELNESGRELLTQIQHAALRMDQLITGLLAFSRLGKEAPRRSFIDMQQLVDSVWQELSVGLKHEEVQFHASKLPPAEGDSRLIRQVIANLLSNAVKFSRHKRPSVIEVGFKSIDGIGSYYVKDNGAGFDMSYSTQIFKMFKRLHSEESFEGTGIGLATASRIIDRHGGRIWVEAKPDEGATFFFTLPRGEGPAERPSACDEMLPYFPSPRTG